jgi:hypothetical protein
MNRLLISALLTLVPLASSSASTVDVGYHYNQGKLRFRTATADSGDIRLYPSNRYNPVRLPCDVEFFGGESLIVYEGPVSGPAVWPRFEERLYLGDSTTPLVSTGYSPGGPTFDFRATTLPGALAPLSSVLMGYHTVNAIHESLREGLYQPGDLPADTLVRLEIKVLAVDANGVELPDSDPSDNIHDYWVMRQCTCQ